jgi:hypothetical protein
MLWQLHLIWLLETVYKDFGDAFNRTHHPTASRALVSENREAPSRGGDGSSRQGLLDSWQQGGWLVELSATGGGWYHQAANKNNTRHPSLIYGACYDRFKAKFERQI